MYISNLYGSVLNYHGWAFFFKFQPHVFSTSHVSSSSPSHLPKAVSRPCGCCWWKWSHLWMSWVWKSWWTTGVRWSPTATPVEVRDFNDICQTAEDSYPLVNVHITDGKSPFLMGKLTISMAIFNSYVSLPEGIGSNIRKISKLDLKLCKCCCVVDREGSWDCKSSTVKDVDIDVWCVWWVSLYLRVTCVSSWMILPGITIPSMGPITIFLQCSCQWEISRIQQIGGT